MRTLMLEIEPFDSVKAEMSEMFGKIRSFEIIETLKMDYKEGICIEIVEFVLKDGVCIQDLKRIGNMEILNILKSDGNSNTCLIRYTEPEETKGLFQESDLGLIHTIPTIISQDQFTVSMMGERKNLMDFVEMMRTHAGIINKMSIRKAAYRKADILAVLTDKQREVMVAAFENGYYDYPKRISSVQLSNKVKISKPTLLQHLRKAEGRILREIMGGLFQLP